MRNLTRLTWLVGAIAVVGCALWALRPLAPQDSRAPGWEPPHPAQPAPKEGRPAIDRNAFAAGIWSPSDSAQRTGPSPAEAAEETRTLNIRLIAIIDEGDGLLRAAIYDAQTDRLEIVSSGDRVGGHTVTAVAAGGVELSDGRSARRLALREGSS